MKVFTKLYKKICLYLDFSHVKNSKICHSNDVSLGLWNSWKFTFPIVLSLLKLLISLWNRSGTLFFCFKYFSEKKYIWLGKGLLIFNLDIWFNGKNITLSRVTNLLKLLSKQRQLCIPSFVDKIKEFYKQKVFSR